MGGSHPHSVQAAELIGNLPQANDNDGTYDLRLNIRLNIRKGIAFTLPSGSDYSLKNAILRFGNYDEAAEAPTTYKQDLDSLLTLCFQSFKKVKAVA
jgi:hypothetical protein